ncbi:MAG TPA: Coq4 family protein [Dongiaceae bacterium]|nr:Coq4 family protein [Dongiaceae bacterium]
MGDAAAMKAAMFGVRAYPEIAQKLRLLRTPFPAIDLDPLRALPESSFGRQYAAFMDRNGLRPFLVSPEVAEELWPEHVLEVRYPLLHDAFHVLLDFDVSLVGELGVWSFVAAQHYSPAYDRAGWLGATIYPLIAPRKRAALAAAARRGRALGERAACLIAEPLELYWRDPIEEVRVELRIQEPAIRTYAPGAGPW